MSFATTISALSSKVDGLIANRVAKFAYTQQAYNSDDVNGVTEYDYSAEQNIPTSTASVLKVNETILTKGWRTQASAITRMLMNHFLGRTSYNLNKTVDFLKSLMTAITDNMGVAEGFATLDANGRIPSGQLTEEVMEYKGEWNADTNTPELDEETGKKGDVYKVSVSGTQDLGEGEKYFRAGTYIIFNGTAYTVISGNDVAKVNNIAPDNSGNVALNSSNIPVEKDGSISIYKELAKLFKQSFYLLLGRDWITLDALVDVTYCYNRYLSAKGIWLANCGHTSTGSTKISYDSLTWEDSTLPSGEWDFVFLKKPANGSESVIIAYGFDGIRYSKDGITWNNAVLEGESMPTSPITKFVCSDSNCFAIPDKNTSAFLHPLRSSDGINWEYCEDFYNETTICVIDVKYVKNKWFVLEYATARCSIYCSADTINWQLASMEITLTGSKESLTNLVATDASYYFASSNRLLASNVQASFDGVTWTSAGTTPLSASCILYASNITLLAVDATTTGTGFGIKRFHESTGSWLATNVSSGRTEKELNYANGIWVLTEANQGIRYLQDNDKTTVWVQTSHSSETVSTIKYCNGIWLARIAKRVYYSFDAINWSGTALTEADSNDYTRFYAGETGIVMYPSSNTGKLPVRVSSVELLLKDKTLQFNSILPL